MRPIHLVFVGSIFLSAFLLFLIQPLVTKLLLPSYGGSPAVWNTALVLFQVLLLAGYLYAHLLTRWASRRTRLWLHALVLLLPLLALPPALPAAAGTAVANNSTWPALSLLGALSVAVAAPFFVLATSSSLIQSWWSSIGGFPRRDDPYWLYGASNLGSLLALLSYPFVVEPALGGARQRSLWTTAYAVFALLTAVALGRASLPASQPSSEPASRPAAAAHPAERISAGRKALWVIRAAVGSSLLLSFTMQISSDLAPMPLLWVLPLALYLITFILAFGFTERLPRPLVAGAAVVALSAALGILLVQGRYPFAVLLAISLGALFCGALLCHRDLAADRPAAGQLTGYYLWIALGGALGGVLNSLVAPLVFRSLAELPLTLMALCVLLYVAPAGRAQARRDSAVVEPGHRAEGAAGGGRAGALGLIIKYKPPWWVGILAALALVAPIAVALRDIEIGPAVYLVALCAVVMWGLANARYVGVVAASAWLPCILLLGGVADAGSTLIAKERSFFGVVRVRDDAEGVELVHGTTVHGRQLHDPALRRIPATYHYPEGPLGSLVKSAPAGGRIAVVGLGTGALAALAQAGQEVVFYEIDPLIERLARAHFTYIEDSPAAVRVVLGDGRIALGREPDGSFDLIIVDVFSSDFVPVHFLTDEALDLMLRKVRPAGVVALHISNRHVDLRRVVRGYAESHGVAAVCSDYIPTEADARRGAYPTSAVALAPRPAVIRALAEQPLWADLTRSDVPAVRWTDDHAGLLDALR